MRCAGSGTTILAAPMVGAASVVGNSQKVARRNLVAGRGDAKCPRAGTIGPWLTAMLRRVKLGRALPDLRFACAS